MELRIYLTPFIRLNIYTRGFTISFGKRGLGWLTFGRRGVTGSIPTGIPWAYLSESRSWKELERPDPDQMK